MNPDLATWDRSRGMPSLIRLGKSQTIAPFEIDKRGFGSAAAWLAVGEIAKVRKKLNRQEALAAWRSPYAVPSFGFGGGIGRAAASRRRERHHETFLMMAPELGRRACQAIEGKSSRGEAWSEIEESKRRRRCRMRKATPRRPRRPGSPGHGAEMKGRVFASRAKGRARRAEAEDFQDAEPEVDDKKPNAWRQGSGDAPVR